MAIKSTHTAKKSTITGKTKPKKVVLGNKEQVKTIKETKDLADDFNYLLTSEDIAKPIPKIGTPEYQEILKKFGLTIKQERFCTLYSLHTKYFGNGVQSYITAYNPDKSKPNRYNTARAGSAENLTKPSILAYINYLMEQDGFNDEFADSQISFLMKQNADFGAKLGAIKQYNELKGRIKQKMELSADQELKAFWLSIVNTPDK